MPGSKKTDAQIVALCGSPHRNGNTATILKLLFNELSGIKKKIYSAYELYVNPCTGCGFCSREFGCIFNDGMNEIYKAIHHSRILIIASPLYFSHLPSPLKSIIDRCQVFWEYYNRGNKPMHNQYGFALLIGGGDYSNMFVPSVITLRHFFNSLNYRFDEKKYLLLPAINSKKDIKNDDISTRISILANYIKELL
ncbi:MAG: flavodoxin family protein [Spirochaetes bacterium]|nr:flavodoxin family protein [Spirochaetota bacterium]